MRVTMASSLLAIVVLSGCSSSTPNVQSNQTAATRGARSVAAIAEDFRAAVNGRDARSVAELAPNTSGEIQDFLIGGGPYETVECYEFDGKDECRVVNGIADFVFVVDVASELVTEITYVGGA